MSLADQPTMCFTSGPTLRPDVATRRPLVSPASLVIILMTDSRDGSLQLYNILTRVHVHAVAGEEGTLLVLHLVNRPEQIICYCYMYQSSLRSLARFGRFIGDEW